MLASLILVLGLISTPVATPGGPNFDPDWVQPLGEPAVSQPIIHENLAYIASDGGRITAIDTIDESIEWQAIPGESASSTLALSDDVLFVPGERGTLYLLDALNGEELSARSLGSAPLTMPLFFGESMVVADRQGTVSVLDRDTLTSERHVVMDGGVIGHGVMTGHIAVYTTSAGSLVAVDVETGEIIWQAVLEAPSGQPFALEDGDIVVGSNNGVLARYSIDDGSIAWQVPAGSGNIFDHAWSPNGLLVSFDGGGVLNLDPDTGDVHWQQVLRENGVFASDTCEDQCVMAANGDSLVAITTATGAIREFAALPGESISGSIAADDHIILVISGSGDVMLWRLSGE